MIKTEHVTDCLRFLTDLSMAYTTTDDGYVVIKKDCKRHLEGNPKRPLILYQETLPDLDDVYLVNPFSEGQKINPGSAWFYRTLRRGVVSRVMVLMEHLLQEALNEKNKTSTEHHPPETVAILSKLVSHVDEKLLDEFRTLLDHVDDFIVILYRKTTMCTTLRSPLLDDPAWEPIQKFRKKSIQTLKLLLSLILKTDHPEKRFSVEAMDHCPPKLSSYLGCVYKVYKEINLLLDEHDSSYAVDLGAFKLHLDSLPEYTGNAKFSVQMAPQHKPPQGTPAPAVPPAYPNQPAPPGTQPSYPQTPPPSGPYVPGPIRPDGTQGPPQPIPHGPTGMFNGSHGYNQPPAPTPGMFGQQQYVPPPMFGQSPAPQMYGNPPPQQMFGGQHQPMFGSNNTVGPYYPGRM